MLPARHQALIDKWMPSLREIESIDVIWLDGSLASNRANPGSDIDIRFGIRDEDFEQLWSKNSDALSRGLGRTLLLAGFWRLLTEKCIIVEMMAFPTSELDGKEFFEWEILFSRLPDGKPSFKRIAPKPPSETWPEKDALTPEKLGALSAVFLNELARVPGAFHNGELLSAWASHDWVREELLKIFYLRTGVQFSARSKHFSEVLREEFLADLGSTYSYLGEDALTVSAAASALIHIYTLLGKHLNALNDKVGGGFEADWFDRVRKHVEEELGQYIDP